MKAGNDWHVESPEVYVSESTALERSLVILFILSVLAISMDWSR